MPLEYMNTLFATINIFDDHEIVRFLKQDFESDMVQSLRYEYQMAKDLSFSMLEESDVAQLEMIKSKST